MRELDPDALVDIPALRVLWPEIPAGSIRRWASTGRLPRFGRDWRGRTLYRVGDLRDLVANIRCESPRVPSGMMSAMSDWVQGWDEETPILVRGLGRGLPVPRPLGPMAPVGRVHAVRRLPSGEIEVAGGHAVPRVTTEIAWGVGGYPQCPLCQTAVRDEGAALA